MPTGKTRAWRLKRQIRERCEWQREMTARPWQDLELGCAPPHFIWTPRQVSDMSRVRWWRWPQSSGSPQLPKLNFAVHTKDQFPAYCRPYLLSASIRSLLFSLLPLTGEWRLSSPSFPSHCFPLGSTGAWWLHVLECFQEGKRVWSVVSYFCTSRDQGWKNAFFSQQILRNHDYFLKELLFILSYKTNCWYMQQHSWILKHVEWKNPDK